MSVSIDVEPAPKPRASANPSSSRSSGCSADRSSRCCSSGGGFDAREGVVRPAVHRAVRHGSQAREVSRTYRGGTFIEAGANDGIAQSNSYFLENKYGWNGVLVEPVPKYFDMCKRARDVHMVNCGLGPFEKDGERAGDPRGRAHEPAGQVDEKLLHGRSVRQHARSARASSAARRRSSCARKVRALSNVLDELAIASVDFFSLDVEGFELEVLKGSRLHAACAEIPAHRNRAVRRGAGLPGQALEMIESLSHHDFLFRRVD